MNVYGNRSGCTSHDEPLAPWERDLLGYSGMTVTIYTGSEDVPLVFQNVHEDSVKERDGFLIFEQHPSRGTTMYSVPMSRVHYFTTDAE